MQILKFVESKNRLIQIALYLSLMSSNLNAADTVSPIFTTAGSLPMQAISRLNVSQLQAQALLKEALSIAEQKNFHISVAIVDWSGDLVTFARSDFASKVSIDVAVGKARTAALIQSSSKLFEDFINNKQQISMLSIQSIVPLQGGLPIYQDGQIIGAIGVSGAPGGELDELIALATLRSLNLSQD